MRRTSWRSMSWVVVLGLLVMACEGPNRSTAPSAASGFHVAVSVSPNTLRGATAATDEGQGGCAAVDVIVNDNTGALVDGAFVVLTTTLGRFPATATRSESVGVTGVTAKGVFKDVICAKAERGTGILTANVENATGTAVFTVF